MPLTRRTDEGGTSPPQGSRAASEAYSPYSVDWRFLPERLLFLKDLVRHHVVRLNNAVARSPALSPLWVETIGKRTLSAILAADVLFIHVPKTGGTSISRILYGRNLPHFTAEFYRTVFGKALAHTPTFAVMRHPVQRLMSCYRFTICGGTEIMASNRYERMRLKGLDSFPAFVDFLIDAAERQYPLPSTFHPQSAFIADADNRVLVDRLFCLDDEGRLPAALNDYLGVENIPRLNATQTVAVALTSETEAKIRSLYGADFELYDRLAADGGSAEIKGRFISRA